MPAECPKKYLLYFRSPYPGNESIWHWVEDPMMIHEDGSDPSWPRTLGKFQLGSVYVTNVPGRQAALRNYVWKNQELITDPVYYRPEGSSCEMPQTAGQDESRQFENSEAVAAAAANGELGDPTFIGDQLNLGGGFVALFSYDLPQLPWWLFWVIFGYAMNKGYKGLKRGEARRK